MAALTPMMQQYLKMHEQVSDCLMFFRLGDFYEMFFDDAINASKALDLVLTGRDCGLDEKAPMCGVPAQAVDSYIAKLVEKGYKVAICEQMSDPKLSKGLVDREIVRIVSSGTIIEGRDASQKANNYIACLFYNKTECSTALVDVSTGETIVNEFSLNLLDRSALSDYISIMQPAEILTNPILYSETRLKQSIESLSGFSISVLDSSYFRFEDCANYITEQLKIYSLVGTGLEGKDNIVKACGALFRYLKETQKNSLQHINRISLRSSDSHMVLDHATKRNLELTETIFLKSQKGSLLWVLDHSSSSLGMRTLQKWITYPLTDLDEIISRHEAVGEITDNSLIINEIKKIISKMSDIQRLCSKIAYRTCNGRDLLALAKTSRLFEELKYLLNGMSSKIIEQNCLAADSLNDIANYLEMAINTDCSATVGDGSLLNEGFDADLDELREFKSNAKDLILEIEVKEREASGIKNLKIKYNRVFGYCFEVTKSNISSVPPYFIRKQTLSNAERYYTKELKDLEDRMLSAQDEIAKREEDLYSDILDSLNKELPRIFLAGENIGVIDAINSYAFAAFQYGYIRPKLNEDGLIKIVSGRHPVVERLIDKKTFIENDCLLDNESNQMLIITGPNMAGKSTFIRQNAIICIMCQIGSFVPALEADLCIIDRIFTRVGASDDLIGGQSTFMVEMSEVSNILRNATKNSLIILDEVGRGTSTYDGISIARAIVEYICDKNKIGAKCLFATHYHELTNLETSLDNVKNYSIRIEQSLSELTFSHLITSGPADKSYGIEVAKIAGLPEDVIANAEKYLLELEESQMRKPKRRKAVSQPEMNENSLLNYKSTKILAELVSLPLNDLTPIEVMGYVARLQKEMS